MATTSAKPAATAAPAGKADVVIIGSGAGGGPMAHELARAGFRVVLLEKGKHRKREEFVHDEIEMSRRNFFVPFPWEEPHLVRKGASSKYERSNTGWTSNVVGGGTVHMSGFFWRLHPVDFKLRTELGPVKGANLADWPITYDDLAPFYDRAEAQVGVSGLDMSHPFAPPRKKPYPMPPLEEHPIAKEIDRVGGGLGMHPFPTPRGISSRPMPEQDRGACTYCALCGSYGCEMGAKGSSLESFIPGALKTGKCDLRPESMVTSIEVDEKTGLASEVVYLDRDGKTQRVAGKVIVVSCTAIESARLLLNSKSKKFPSGLSNNAGQVGKNLVFSSFGEGRAHFNMTKRAAKWPWLKDPAPFVQRSVQDYYLMKDSQFGFRKGGTISFLWSHPNPIFAAIKVAGTGGEKAIFGKELKDKLRASRDEKILQFEVFGEFFANDGTYVGVDETVKDKFGLPVAAITIERHPTDYAQVKFLVDRGMEVLEALEPDSTELISSTGETAILQGGTCRMGNDPKTSVLDKFCRSHEVPNLYVVDGSFMPTSGGVAFTLTIMANAFRVASHLVGELKKG
jgi:choline dehydrogenase-like flavoprotein